MARGRVCTEPAESYQLLICQSGWLLSHLRILWKEPDRLGMKAPSVKECPISLVEQTLEEPVDVVEAAVLLRLPPDTEE